ncbi:hypothetical protein KGF42_18730 [Clostridioides sp. ZZV15-6383]|uniref:hypothetical protein n=1 Tax=Clostridioides sp. ZZV15-6383 TaxID=2811498 RepID=UPI001D12AEB7|nr:hypothetical protein [Clostridioides sp. ZZV15-6383]
MIISIFSFCISFNKFDVKEYNRILNLENYISEPFTIPRMSELSDPVIIYEALSDTAKSLKINIYRNQISVNKDGIYEIEKYVFFTNKTKYYDYLHIDGNKFTYKNQDKLNNSFISSNKDTNNKQIGTINEFGKNDKISIKSLQ